MNMQKTMVFGIVTMLIIMLVAYLPDNFSPSFKTIVIIMGIVYGMLFIKFASKPRR